MCVRLFFVVSCAILLTVLWLTHARGHHVMIDACFRGPAPTVKVGEQPNENGLLSELYDRNGDGQIDIEVMTPIRGTAKATSGQVEYYHDQFPLFYLVDTTMNKGEPDTLYIDKDGDGRCSTIVVYKDLTKPHMPDKDHRESASQVDEVGQ